MRPLRNLIHAYNSHLSGTFVFWITPLPSIKYVKLQKVKSPLKSAYSKHKASYAEVS